LQQLSGWRTLTVFWN